MGTDTRDQPRGEIAPVAHVGWKRDTDVANTELEQCVACATSECVLEPPRKGGRQIEGIARDSEQQMAAWGQRKRRHEGEW
jgi:hypothetical protein